jgi:predicted transcriptional regulator
MSPTPKVPPELHELEAEVMEDVWRRDGEVAVRDVMEALNGSTSKPRAYTTYMTIMGRLHEKGLLTRRREGKTDLYLPAFTREEYANLRARADVESIVARYGDAAFGHFARQMASLDPDRRRRLQRLARES